MKILVAYDFDNTIINDTCDAKVLQLLPLNVQPDCDFDKRDCWRQMHEVFQRLYNQQIKKETLLDAVKEIKPVADMINFIKVLKDTYDVEQIIISDANYVFIKEWLDQYELFDKFSAIYTNSATFTGDKLDLGMYHVQNWCYLSNTNICKGFVLERHIEKRRTEGITYKHIVYIGDGRNDICPALKLRKTDFLFARKYYELYNILKRDDDNIHDLKISMIPWMSTDDILIDLKERVFKI